MFIHFLAVRVYLSLEVYFQFSYLYFDIFLFIVHLTTLQTITATQSLYSHTGTHGSVGYVLLKVCTLPGPALFVFCSG